LQKETVMSKAKATASDWREETLACIRGLILEADPEMTEERKWIKLAESPEQRALVGRQGAGAPLFALATSDCQRDFEAMKARGVTFDGEPQTMPYGTGVLLNDLYGNKLYLNEDPC
jgi:Glyoxalase/Bleomycin resistance protein/Dioxygenase superfamily